MRDIERRKEEREQAKKEEQNKGMRESKEMVIKNIDKRLK